MGGQLVRDARAKSSHCGEGAHIERQELAPCPAASSLTFCVRGQSASGVSFSSLRLDPIFRRRLEKVRTPRKKYCRSFFRICILLAGARPRPALGDIFNFPPLCLLRNIFRGNSPWSTFETCETDC